MFVLSSQAFLKLEDSAGLCYRSSSQGTERQWKCQESCILETVCTDLLLLIDSRKDVCFLIHKENEGYVLMMSVP